MKQGYLTNTNLTSLTKNTLQGDKIYPFFRSFLININENFITHKHSFNQKMTFVTQSVNLNIENDTQLEEKSEYVLRPFYFTKHGVGQSYWNKPKPENEGKDMDDWLDDGESFELPWRTLNQNLKLEMTQTEMIGYHKGLIFFTLSNIEALVYFRMQHGYSQKVTSDKFCVGHIDKDTWLLLAQQLRRSKPTHFSRRSKKLVDGVLHRSSKIINHGFDKLEGGIQKMTWTKKTGFPTLISSNWHVKKYPEPSYPSTLFKTKITSFTLIYRVYPNDLRCTYEYEVYRYCKSTKSWNESL